MVVWGGRGMMIIRMNYSLIMLTAPEGSLLSVTPKPSDNNSAMRIDACMMKKGTRPGPLGGPESCRVISSAKPRSGAMMCEQRILSSLSCARIWIFSDRRLTIWNCIASVMVSLNGWLLHSNWCRRSLQSAVQIVLLTDSRWR